ncbi:hypothetical protein [Halobacteriaceae bacterium SHR40]|uniref:hypothetical protein n=1 Tax=Halovenus amylolytica TaxID=2500550 RepID=UPI000FE38AB6
MALSEYLLTVLNRAVTDPKSALSQIPLELNYYGRRINQHYFSLIGPSMNGHNLVDEDWDTAIILDACRYDIFNQNCPEEWGVVEKRTAPGSQSREYFQKTFYDGEYHDTVYITSNPYITDLPEDTFHTIKLDETWEDTAQQAPPGVVTQEAKKAHKEYPKKRIIVHYMQPHLPFFGVIGEHVWDKLGWHRGMYYPKDVDVKEVKKAYTENLQVVLEHVKDLLVNIDGKIIITSDHGEMLGERMYPIPVRGYDHFHSLYLPELIEVPWVEIESDNRREIESSPPEGTVQSSSEVQKKRLKALGYVE